MPTAAGESPTGVFEVIGIPIQAGDTDMGGTGGIGAANGKGGIALMTRATPATVTLAEALEHNESRKRPRCGPWDAMAPCDWRSRVERTMR